MTLEEEIRDLKWENRKLQIHKEVHEEQIEKLLDIAIITSKTIKTMGDKIDLDDLKILKAMVDKVINDVVDEDDGLQL